MVKALKREFAAVEAMAEVGRLLLESRGLRTVLDALLPRMSRVVDCHSASVTLVDPMSPDRARVFEFVPALGESLPVRRVAIIPANSRIACRWPCRTSRTATLCTGRRISTR